MQYTWESSEERKLAPIRLSGSLMAQLISQLTFEPLGLYGSVSSLERNPVARAHFSASAAASNFDLKMKAAKTETKQAGGAEAINEDELYAAGFLLFSS